MKCFRYILPPLALLMIVGCLVTGHTLRKQSKPHICQYKKVEGSIEFVDGFGYVLNVKGKKNWIDIVSPGRESDVYQALEMQSNIVADNYEFAKKNNKIFVVGKLSTDIHYQAAPSDGQDAFREYRDPADEECYKRRNFIFQKWYIKKPFKETQWIEEDNARPKFIDRTSLKIADFDPTFLKRKNIRLTAEDLRRYVQ